MEKSPTDHFDIQLSESAATDVDLLEAVARNFENVEHCDLSLNCSESQHQSELMRASLTEVVLSPSCHMIEYCPENGEADGKEVFVQTFDSVIVQEDIINTDKYLSGDTPLLTTDLPEFTSVCSESEPPTILSTTVDPPISTVSTEGPDKELSPSNDTPVSIQQVGIREQDFQSDSVDFEDAENPCLLSQTVPQEDSGDEFDFELSTSKANEVYSNKLSSSDVDVTIQNVQKTQVENRLPECKEGQKQETNGVFTSASLPTPLSSTLAISSGCKRSANTGSPASMPGTTTLPSSNEPTSTTIAQEESQDRSYVITSTAADWDNVETVEAGFKEAQCCGGESMSSVPPLLAFSDVWQHFQGMDHSAVKDKIQVAMEKNGLAGLVSWLFGPPKLRKELTAERETVFCAAATSLDNADSQHVQSLQTIYRVLTGSRFNCQRFGAHWEEIGFQGRDPATDLRGTGMLALIQMVYFLQDEGTAQLARDMYKLSLHPTQNFPFCVMCINISRLSLQTLREGLLNRECNRQRTVMPVVNQFYTAALLCLYRIWKQGKTISDSGFVIKEVEGRAKKQTKELMRELHSYRDSRRSLPASAEGTRVDDLEEDNVQYLNVAKSNSSSTAQLY